MLANLKIEATGHTPSIDFNVEEAKFLLSGMSYPENTFEFYRPIHRWLEKYYEQTTNEETTINMELVYLNSSSLKAYFDIFNIIEDAHANGKKSIINWIYEGDDDIMEETGEDFQEDFEELRVNLIKK
ncbi:MAG: DUF1987 domain-containing protein [Campylobacterota bacterium]|nr:DUF1987 domain-containing protein [Campylobacterota bacterium]